MSDAERVDDGDGTADAVGEGAVSSNQASIPATIRESADIEDGDRLRWYYRGGRLTVEVVRQREGIFDGFQGFEGSEETADPDRAGLKPAGELDAGLEADGATEAATDDDR